MFGLSTKITFMMIVAIAVVVAFLAYRASLVRQGHDEAIAAIKQANDKAQGDANKGVTDVETCYAGGGDWDRSRGVCASTPASK